MTPFTQSMQLLPTLVLDIGIRGQVDGNPSECRLMVEILSYTDSQATFRARLRVASVTGFSFLPIYIQGLSWRCLRGAAQLRKEAKSSSKMAMSFSQSELFF